MELHHPLRPLLRSMFHTSTLLCRDCFAYRNTALKRSIRRGARDTSACTVRDGGSGRHRRRTVRRPVRRYCQVVLPGGGVAASTRAPSTWMPLAASARRQAASVDPVVTTSSTSNTGPAGGSPGRSRTRRLAARWLAPSRCSEASGVRNTSAVRTRTLGPLHPHCCAPGWNFCCKPSVTARARSATTNCLRKRRRQPDGAGTTTNSSPPSNPSPPTPSPPIPSPSYPPPSGPASIGANCAAPSLPTAPKNGRRSARTWFFHCSTIRRGPPR